MAKSSVVKRQISEKLNSFVSKE